MQAIHKAAVSSCFQSACGCPRKSKWWRFEGVMLARKIRRLQIPADPGRAASIVGATERQGRN